MFLRGLSSLLTRRCSPLGNRSAQAVSSLGIGVQKAPGSADGRPARSFHTLRDLADGGGVYGAAATAAITGFVAALYYNNTVNKNSDVAAEVTGEAAEVAVEEKETVKEPYVSREAAIKAGFVDKDGKVNWPEYFDYVNFQTNYGGMPLYDKEEYAKEVTNREAVTRKKNREAVKWEDVKVDEPIMKARFEDWMKEYGRSYRSEQEKARRYEIFKKTAVRADIDNASRPKGACIFAPNGFADWSEEECKAFDCHSDWNWDTYVDHINKMAANGWVIGNENVKTSEAVKQMVKELRAELRARKREGK